jgi:RNA polymerase sigma factor (sigma-70 family)
MTLDDTTLLRRFAVEGSEADFSELVRRYLDLVYSAALRQVNGNSGLAADICQSVFIDLARKARSIRPGLALAAWLHRATRLAALAAMRAENRRAVREQEAAAMRELQQTEPAPDWTAFRPMIDEALDDLSDRDREAVLLRYCRNQSLRRVADSLGVNENAARMRVDRALDKLRVVLAKRGVTSTSSTLAAALAGQAITVAPTGLAATVTTTALAVAAASTASTLGMIPLMASMKMKVALATTLATAVATPVLIQRNQIARLGEDNRSLKMHTAELDRLRLENAQLVASRLDPNELASLRAQQSELLRLRAEVAALRQQNQQVTATKTPAAPVPLKAVSEPEHNEFISSEAWTEVGSDTPERAFQSFMAVLKSGDTNRIASTVHWDVQWKEPVTDDDKKLVEKSMQDYLDTLQKAPGKLAAFRLGSLVDRNDDRKRVFFSTRAGDGTQFDSNFEMIYTDGLWKPVLSMGWFDRGNSSGFFTTPVFGPRIDLDP